MLRKLSSEVLRFLVAKHTNDTKTVPRHTPAIKRPRSGLFMALQQSRETAYEVCVLRAIKNQNEN
jgi:hypothetical protein